jgi:hypothetical protein
MTHHKIVGAMIAGIIALGAAATAAYAYKGEKLAPQAKIGLEEARQIALKAFAGDITDEELERERGGSGLRYSFDIKNGSVTHEVGVRRQDRAGATASSAATTEPNLWYFRWFGRSEQPLEENSRRAGVPRRRFVYSAANQTPPVVSGARARREQR